MAFLVTVHHGPFLLVVASGPAKLGDFLGAIDVVRTESHERGDGRALLDLLAVETKLSPEEHQKLGRYLAEALGHLERVASVVPDQFRVHSSELSAQSAGLNIRTFLALRDAIAWLTE